MYIQARNRQPRDPDSLPVLSSIREVTRFVTSSSGDPEFKPWANHEIRLKTPPSENDLRSARIDLNQGFNEYWEKHCSQPRHIHFHQNGVAKGLEKDEVLRKTFEASLKWIKDNNFLDNPSAKQVPTTDANEKTKETKADSPDSGHPPAQPMTQPPSIPSETTSLSPTPETTNTTTTYTCHEEIKIQVSNSSSSSLIAEELLADLLISDSEDVSEEGLIPMQRSSSSATTSSCSSSAPVSSVSSSLASARPKIITTANALYLLLQLPFEGDERSRPSWLVSKYQGTIYLFSVENYSTATNTDAKAIHHHHRSNGHSNGNGFHYEESPAILAEKANELIRYRTKVFFNLMTEKLPLNRLHDKINRCVINEAFFDGHRILYSTIVNAVNLKDRFVDLRLAVPKRTKREHLEKLQKVWSMAVIKPSSEIIIGTRSLKCKEGNSSVPEGRLIDIEKYYTSKIPAEVSEFTARNTCENPLWDPSVSYDFLQRFIEYLDKRVMDDPKTVYQLIPEGFYGRGFSLLSIQKLNLKGCDPLIPDWFLVD